MEPTNFQEKILALEGAEDLIGLGRDASELRQEFEDFIIEAERVEQVKRLEASDLGTSYEEHDYAPIKEAFFDAYKSFQEKRKKQVELKTVLENENLKQKKVLVERLKDVIENEEKIGTAFNAYKEIHENWKKVGDIPRDKREALQKEYSRLLEIFFYNIKIYKELKEHDYKRNQQLKEAIIFKLKQLRTANLPVRDAEANLRSLQDEWEEIGPVQNEGWESLKNAYWETVRGVYEKFNEHYEQQRVVLKANIDAKKSLIEKLLVVNQNVENALNNDNTNQDTQVQDLSPSAPPAPQELLDSQKTSVKKSVQKSVPSSVQGLVPAQTIGEPAQLIGGKNKLKGGAITKQQLQEAADTIVKICGNTSILINQIVPSNFEEYWGILKPLMKDVYQNDSSPESMKMKNDLFEIVVTRDNVGEAMWYIYTGLLLTSIVQLKITSRGCISNPKTMEANYQKFLQQEEQNKKSEQNASTTYTLGS